MGHHSELDLDPRMASLIRNPFAMIGMARPRSLFYGVSKRRPDHLLPCGRSSIVYRANRYSALPGNHSLRHVGIAAAVWALLFAAISLYWALAATSRWDWAIDGYLGARTIGRDIARMVEDHDVNFIVTLWVSVVVKALLALIPLALVQPWGRFFSSWLRLAGCWIAGALLALYGLINGIEHLAMVTGAVDTPAALGGHAARWHLYLWDPFWLLGGLLFLATAWLAGRSRGRTR